MREEQQQSLVHRGVTFGVVTFLAAATILTIVGTVASTVQPPNPEDETRPRRWKRLRGCFAYLTKKSSALPLWKSLLIKSAVTFITTLGAGVISIVISNLMASDKETIRETVAAILDIDLGDARRRRSAGQMERSRKGMTTTICNTLNLEATNEHCVTIILILIVFIVAIVSPAIIMLASRLHTRFLEARAHKMSPAVKENNDDIESSD